MKITAKLKNAAYAESGLSGRYCGNIYDDIHKRWPDGAFIWTSAVKRVDGNIVTTLNSVYEVELAA